MAKNPTKTVKKLPVKEKPLHIPLSFEDIIKKAVIAKERSNKIYL